MSDKKQYRQRNRLWLQQMAEQENVQQLAEGVYYKVLSGACQRGKHPMLSSIVIVHYSGKTIDGREFDSSRGGEPLAIRLRQLIEGWQIALQQMCVGDRWELYLSADRAYGNASQPGIPGGSTLIFEVELLGIG